MGKSICRTKSKSVQSAGSGPPNVTLLKTHSSTNCISTSEELSAEEMTTVMPSASLIKPSSCNRTKGDLSLPRDGPLRLTRTLVEESFHLVSRVNTISRDTVIFLWTVKEFNFDVATVLAKEFHWKLQPSLSKLRAMWNA